LNSARSRRAQIIRHVAELAQHDCITKIAGRRITSATERDRTGMTLYFPKTLSMRYAAAGLGHSTGSPATMALSVASNGKATKYLIPAMSSVSSVLRPLDIVSPLFQMSILFL